MFLPLSACKHDMHVNGLSAGDFVSQGCWLDLVPARLTSPRNMMKHIFSVMACYF